VFGVAVLAVFSALAIACGPADEPEGDETCEFPAGERGTPECQRWHEAVCAWANECTALEHCECVDQASAVTCISDAEATRCADALEAASCGSPPLGCDLMDLADRTVARAACDQYVAAVCAHEQECSGLDPVECAAAARAEGVDCTLAVAVKPSFDQCLPDIEALPCTANDIPASCDGAILLDR
jgi:hypothetical protein